MYLLLLLCLASVDGYPSSTPRAFCKVEKGTVSDSDVSGFITITKSPDGGSKFSGSLYGLTTGLHGFHIHEKGSLNDNCKAAGGHLNPGGNNHGARDASERHMGDLGNVETRDDGTTVVNIEDGVAKFDDIIGKAIVIHAGEDDLGLGGDEGSLKTGNAGDRVGCCLISCHYHNGCITMDNC